MTGCVLAGEVLVRSRITPRPCDVRGTRIEPEPSAGDLSIPTCPLLTRTGAGSRWRAGCWCRPGWCSPRSPHPVTSTGWGGQEKCGLISLEVRCWPPVSSLIVKNHHSPRWVGHPVTSVLTSNGIPDKEAPWRGRCCGPVHPSPCPSRHYRPAACHGTNLVRHAPRFCRSRVPVSATQCEMPIWVVRAGKAGGCCVTEAKLRQAGREDQPASEVKGAKQGQTHHC
jgi:hypothetical protein